MIVFKGKPKLIDFLGFKPIDVSNVKPISSLGVSLDYKKIMAPKTRMPFTSDSLIFSNFLIIFYFLETPRSLSADYPGPSWTTRSSATLMSSEIFLATSEISLRDASGRIHAFSTTTQTRSLANSSPVLRSILCQDELIADPQDLKAMVGNSRTDKANINKVKQSAPFRCIGNIRQKGRRVDMAVKRFL